MIHFFIASPPVTKKVTVRLIFPVTHILPYFLLLLSHNPRLLSFDFLSFIFLFTRASIQLCFSSSLFKWRSSLFLRIASSQISHPISDGVLQLSGHRMICARFPTPVRYISDKAHILSGCRKSFCLPTHLSLFPFGTVIIICKFHYFFGITI